MQPGCGSGWRAGRRRRRWVFRRAACRELRSPGTLETADSLRFASIATRRLSRGALALATRRSNHGLGSGWHSASVRSTAGYKGRRAGIKRYCLTAGVGSYRGDENGLLGRNIRTMNEVGIEQKASRERQADRANPNNGNGGLLRKPLFLSYRAQCLRRSYRSRFITLFHAATKSCTNFSFESSDA
jgi:hypothetical protein